MSTTSVSETSTLLGVALTSVSRAAVAAALEELDGRPLTEAQAVDRFRAETRVEAMTFARKAEAMVEVTRVEVFDPITGTNIDCPRRDDIAAALGVASASAGRQVHDSEHLCRAKGIFAFARDGKLPPAWPG